MQLGATFPALIAFGTDKRAYLADGWHRYHAAMQIGTDDLEVDLRDGGLPEAVWYSVTANAEHGLRRTNADKRRAVDTALTVKPNLSNHEIARHCGVSHVFVASIREQMEEAGKINEARERDFVRDGKPGQATVAPRTPSAERAPAAVTRPPVPSSGHLELTDTFDGGVAESPALIRHRPAKPLTTVNNVQALSVLATLARKVDMMDPKALGLGLIEHGFTGADMVTVSTWFMKLANAMQEYEDEAVAAAAGMAVAGGE